ncbi:integrase arm-type DNA-binding domain-containing protein [Cupriavidus sp. SW-Y-13]|uniref:tyrosine-type recombinase/integrase n=1 Tax=Cupriavidus sp. SW-Y-13 TaxID=2653854 RepID=UPI001365CD58|nr:integrase arm-type DNA-binding domain-containing protein [Cupriavidus sp. SW-Y-13]MWL88601.1 DUF4102 domain-containing protein [Cupriavidus sp. SW-Y-13]
MPLTDLQIRTAKPQDKPYRKADGGGLFLEVRPNGSRYWRLAYRHLGKQKLLAIGVYPVTSLSEAREARDAAKKLLAAGEDPSAQKRLAKQAAVTAAATTFEAVAKEWHETKRGGWTPKHAVKILESLRANIFPTLGERPIAEITAQELLATLRKIEQRGALETAARVLQRSSAVFRYAVVTGRCERDPAADLKGALKPPVVQHHTALTAKELPEFLRLLDVYDGEELTKLGLRLLMLTFVRTTELRGAKWAEIDLTAAEWRIPAERMKMRDPHIVPLATQSIAVLERLKQLSGHSTFVFPNSRNPQKVMSENTLLYGLYRMGYHGRATGHGFRATASTILNELGKRADVIERQLAHAERNKVRAAYNRAQYLPERRELMQCWADYLDRCVAGASIDSLQEDVA